MTEEKEDTCECCGLRRTLRYCKACRAWLCEECVSNLPLRVVAAMIKMRRRVERRKAKWQGVKVVE